MVHDKVYDFVAFSYFPMLYTRSRLSTYALYSKFTVTHPTTTIPGAQMTAFSILPWNLNTATDLSLKPPVKYIYTSYVSTNNIVTSTGVHSSTPAPTLPDDLMYRPITSVVYFEGYFSTTAAEQSIMVFEVDSDVNFPFSTSQISSTYNLTVNMNELCINCKYHDIGQFVRREFFCAGGLSHPALYIATTSLPSVAVVITIVSYYEVISLTAGIYDYYFITPYKTYPFVEYPELSIYKVYSIHSKYDVYNQFLCALEKVLLKYGREIQKQDGAKSEKKSIIDEKEDNSEVAKKKQKQGYY